MNNKGFAITSIIYGLMLLFVLAVTSFLSILIGRNRRMDALVEGVYDTVSYEEINVDIGMFSEETKTYVTDKKGLYKFDINGNECVVYLPKGVVLVDSNTKLFDGSNDLYYYYATDTSDTNGSNLDNYKKLECINN